MVDLLQVSVLPPFLTERLAKEYTIHDFVDPAEPDKLLDEVGPQIRGILAGGMKGPNANLINRLENLEIIASFSVGFDATDVVAAQKRGVIVTHTPEVLTGDVADLAMTLILMTSRRIGESERFLRAGKWLQGRMDLATTVRGRRLGILGLGRIGRAVARRAEVFGINIAYHDIKPMGDLPYRSYPSLLDLAEASDILLVACEGGKATARIGRCRGAGSAGPGRISDQHGARSDCRSTGPGRGVAERPYRRRGARRVRWRTRRSTGVDRDGECGADAAYREFHQRNPPRHGRPRL